MILSVERRQTVSDPKELTLRPATEKDRSLLLLWRNDPVVVQFSGTGSPVTSAEHGVWFAAALADPMTLIWIAEVEGRPVGQARIDKSDTSGTVSIAVAAEERGRGYGRDILIALQRIAQTAADLGRLRALVHRDNAPSLRVFSLVGFRARSADERGFVEYLWTVDRAASGKNVAG
jgi:UDP-2,4-diacetamido-2,4,6-trideoxy-beta-L-altropyranose hydrolase